MFTPVEVYKGRTTMITVALGVDVSADTLVSEIRTDTSPTSDLLATWLISFATDGTDGELILIIDNSQLGSIEIVNAFMDMKRIVGGEPFQMFGPIPVVFRDVVTA